MRFNRFESDGGERAGGLVFGGRLLAIQIVLAATLAVALGIQVLRTHTQPDFAMFWAAHHVASPYDAKVLSSRLTLNGAFPYAPPFLLITLPLAWVSMPVGYLTWIALSAAILVASLRRLSAPIVLAVPAVVMAASSGQTSLVMAAALFAGASLSSRPILAGALFGLAACIKPQAVLLLPLALVAAAQWRMLASAGATGLALSGAATVVYGPAVWADWLASLPDYVQANDAVFTARYLALPGPWKFVALAVGAVWVWRAGRQGRLELAVFIGVAAALLGSLHAMDYDAAILAPFGVSAVLERRWWSLPLALALLPWPARTWSVLIVGLIAIGLSRGEPDGRARRPSDP